MPSTTVQKKKTKTKVEKTTSARQQKKESIQANIGAVKAAIAKYSKTRTAQ